VTTRERACDVAGCSRQLSSLSGLSYHDTLKAWRSNAGAANSAAPSRQGASPSGMHAEDAEGARQLYSSSDARASGGGLGGGAEETGRGRQGLEGRERTNAERHGRGGAAPGDLNRTESDGKDEVLDAVCDLPPNSFWHRRRSSHESLRDLSGEGAASASRERRASYEALGRRSSPERWRSHDALASGSPERRLSGGYEGLGSPDRRLSYARLWLEQSTSFSEAEEDEEDYEIADGQVRPISPPLHSTPYPAPFTLHPSP
jgi:hypothetical protein